MKEFENFNFNDFSQAYGSFTVLISTSISFSTCSKTAKNDQNRKIPKTLILRSVWRCPKSGFKKKKKKKKRLCRFSPKPNFPMCTRYEFKNRQNVTRSFFLKPTFSASPCRLRVTIFELLNFKDFSQFYSLSKILVLFLYQKSSVMGEKYTKIMIFQPPPKQRKMVEIEKFQKVASSNYMEMPKIEVSKKITLDRFSRNQIFFVCTT